LHPSKQPGQILAYAHQKVSAAIPTMQGVEYTLIIGLCEEPVGLLSGWITHYRPIVTDFQATSHIVVYLDDILIFSDNTGELEQLTHQVLQTLLDLNLFLWPEKCSFNKTSVKYLGLIISKGKLYIDPVKLIAVKNWPRPKTVKDIQKFLGFCNFYCHFVKAYSELAWPLFNLIKKGEPFI
jgi:hypothetical protein